MFDIHNLELAYNQAPLRNGRVTYSIRNTISSTHMVAFPGVRTMKRLAKKYLYCEYSEKGQLKRNNLWVIFSIDKDTTLEDRAAFLAAVALHTSFKPK